MTDFLTNLLDRTTQAAPVLERRKPSLFEPVQELAGFGSKITADFGGLDDSVIEENTSGSELVAYNSAERGASALPTAPTDATQFQQSFPALSPRPSEPAFDRSAQTASVTVTEQPSLTSERSSLGFQVPKSDVQPETSRVETIVEKHIVHTESITKIIEARRDNIANSSQNAAPIAPAIAESSRAATQASGPQPSLEVRPGAKKQSDDSSRTSIQPKRSEQAPQPAAIPRAARRIHEKAAAVQPAQPQPPTIHVNIGRIEIRATPQAAPTRPQRVHQPKMSLDEYLRSRNGGN